MLRSLGVIHGMPEQDLRAVQAFYNRYNSLDVACSSTAEASFSSSWISRNHFPISSRSVFSAIANFSRIARLVSSVRSSVEISFPMTPITRASTHVRYFPHPQATSLLLSYGPRPKTQLLQILNSRLECASPAAGVPATHRSFSCISIFIVAKQYDQVGHGHTLQMRKGLHTGNNQKRRKCTLISFILSN
jgi:hypothetical protein